MNTYTKVADNKGRVILGPQFANRTVIISEVDATEVRVTIARVIPEREAWLYENPASAERVQRGMKQSAAGEISSQPPNLTADQALAEQIEDECSP